MPAVAKSSEKGQDQVTMVDVWVQIRGLENALRHYGDVFAGWMEYGGLDPNKAISGVSKPIPLPGPPCDPPWCPYKGPKQIARDVREVANAVAEVADMFEFLAKRVSIEAGRDYYISELPGTRWAKHSGNGNGHGRKGPDRR